MALFVIAERAQAPDSEQAGLDVGFIDYVVLDRQALESLSPLQEFPFELIQRQRDRLSLGRLALRFGSRLRRNASR